MSLPSESQLYLIEIRWHGRGGQGAWTASELLARAAIKGGKYIQASPEFGPERMGAPVTAYNRISNEPIRLHCAVTNPDIVTVLDNTLLKSVNVLEGLEENGILLVNTDETPDQLCKTIKKEPWYDKKTDLSKLKIYTIPATKIAIKRLKMPIPNTAMVGAVLGILEYIEKPGYTKEPVTLESLYSVVRDRFRSDVAEKNIAVIFDAYGAIHSQK